MRSFTLLGWVRCIQKETLDPGLKTVEFDLYHLSSLTGDKEEEKTKVLETNDNICKRETLNRAYFK